MPAQRLKQKLSDGVARLAAFPAPFVGLGFFRSWITLLTDGGIMVGLDGPTHDVVLSLVLVAFALASGHVTPLFRQRWAVVSCLVVALGASALAIVGNASDAGPFWTGTAVAAAAAYASALFILMWCDLYSRLDITDTALAVGLALITAEAVNFLLAGMVDTYRLGALVVLPCLSMFALLRAKNHIPSDRAYTPAAVPPSVEHVPWNLIALVAIYEFTSALCLSLTHAPAGLYSGAANLLAGSAVILCMLFFSERLDLASVCKSPAALLVPGLLLLPFVGNAHGALAGIGAALSSSLFGILVMLVFCDIAQVQGTSPVFLFGVEEAASCVSALGTALGEHGELLASLGISATAAMTALVALTIIAGLTLFNGERIAARWGVRVFGPGKLAEGSLDREHLLAACDAFADSCGLTAREREVLALLARGKTVAEICSELGVARGTAKAHCEHIYTKAGVRSKKELLQRVGQEQLEIRR